MGSLGGEMHRSESACLRIENVLDGVGSGACCVKEGVCISVREESATSMLGGGEQLSLSN